MHSKIAHPASRRFLSFLLSLSVIIGMFTLGNFGTMADSNTHNRSMLAQDTIADGTYFEVSLPQSSGTTRYDDVLAMACLQGILNRESPWRFYINADSTSQEWQSILQAE